MTPEVVELGKGVDGLAKPGANGRGLLFVLDATAQALYRVTP